MQSKTTVLSVDRTPEYVRFDWSIYSRPWPGGFRPMKGQAVLARSSIKAYRLWQKKKKRLCSKSVPGRLLSSELNGEFLE